jgi:hypothetical protein
MGMELHRGGRLRLTTDRHDQQARPATPAMRRHYLADTQAANRSISSRWPRLRSDHGKTDGRAIHRRHCDGETCARGRVEAIVVAAGAARSHCARCDRPVRRAPTTACVAKRWSSADERGDPDVAKAVAGRPAGWRQMRSSAEARFLRAGARREQLSTWLLLPFCGSLGLVAALAITRKP